MRSLILFAAYLLLPSIGLWWFLNANATQNVNRLNSIEIQKIQHHDESVQAEVEAIWVRIEKQLREHGWDKEVGLKPPASAEEIALLEREFGYRLPADYKASLLVHNGSVGEFCANDRLFSTKRLMSVWEMNVFHAGVYSHNKIQPDPKKVSSYYWHPGWIPAAGWDVYVVFVNVENGQVYSYDETNARYDAASWKAWLLTVAERLESGELRLEPGPAGRRSWNSADYNSAGAETK